MAFKHLNFKLVTINVYYVHRKIRHHPISGQKVGGFSSVGDRQACVHVPNFFSVILKVDPQKCFVLRKMRDSSDMHEGTLQAPKKW